MKSEFRWTKWLLVIVCLSMLEGCEKTPAPSPEADKQVTKSQPGWIDSERLSSIAVEPGAWLTGGRDYQQSYHSPLKQITRDNVSELGFAWQYEIDTEHGFEATPDAGTGTEVWKFEPEVDPDAMRKACCGVVNRGVAVWRGKVYVGSLDGYLYALNANDGSVAWKVDTITDRERGYTISLTGSGATPLPARRTSPKIW